MALLTSCGEIENVVATQALVLLVIAINESWKIPIAYFLINNQREQASSERALLGFIQSELGLFP